MATERTFEAVWTSAASTKLNAGSDVAQTFKAKADHNITAVEINFGRTVTKTATVTISIQGVDGAGKPDGNVLATSSPFAFNNLILNDVRKDKITFLASCNVTKDTFYAVVIGVSSASTLKLALGSTATGWEIYDDGPSWRLYSGDGRIGIQIYGTVVIPTVTTQAVTNIGKTSATGNGTITDLGGDINCTKRGYCWNKTGSPTIEDDNREQEGTYYTGSWSRLFTGLDAGTLYYVRAFAYNVDGYGYGNEVEFTTIAEPSITTQAATEIGYQCAMGNGTIVGGEPTERGFEIKLTFSGTLNDYIQHSIADFEGDASYNISTGKWEGTLTKTETETGTFEPEEFELVLGYPSVLGNPSSVFNDKLFKCESYTYRAYMVIGDTTYTGEWVAFDTLCDDGEEQQPTDDISEGNPVVPIIPIEDIDLIEELPEFEWEEPEIELLPWVYPDLPDWEFPDYPPMSWTGDFYYRRPYTKKDLDDLRKKCIIYNKNSIEFALVLRHNMNVLREFFNMMTDYMDKEEFNDFTDLIPPQRLKELYLDPLNPTDFRDMINGFIRNTIDNNMAVNRNFKLIQDGLSDYETESDDAYFKEINSNIKTVTEDDPDVHRLKKKIDSLNREVSFNFSNIMYNLKVLRARLL